MLILVLALVLAACTGDDEDDFPDAEGFDDATPTVAAPAADDEETTPPDEPTATVEEVQETPTTEQMTPTTDAGETPTSDAGETPTAGQETPATGATGDHVFEAGEAGEVELRIDGRSLVLVEVRENDGWTHRVDDDDDDEIEIDFRDNGREIEFEAEIDDGRLKVDVCDTVFDPTGDVHTVGEAGEVEARWDGDNLQLVEVRPADGWTHEVEEEDDDEIEVVFRRGDERVKFELEEDDDRLEAKTCVRTEHSLDGGAMTGGTPQAIPADNTYQAGEAGEVELMVEGRDLRLVEVRPADGWTHRVEEDDDDEIEVEFRDNGREIDFEADIDDDRLEIDVCETELDPQGDIYTVGEAGEVEARWDGEDLELVEVRPAEGWTHEVEEDDDDEIEIVFRRGDERIKFDLEEDDDRLEARTCVRTEYSLE